MVVGAGMGGMAAAARLARLGHRVAIFEAADAVGGKLGLFERDGFRFDTGPSLLTMPFVYHELFIVTGAPLSEELSLRRLDPIARYRFGDGTWFEAAAEDSRMRDNIRTLSPGSERGWDAFMARGAAIWEATRTSFLDAPLRGWRTLAALARRHPAAISTIAPHLTLRALARRYFGDPRLLAFIDRYATYTGSDPRRAPAVLASVPFLEHRYGGWYIDGGLRNLADALARRCALLGVQIRCSTPVSSIIRERVRLRVELADGSALAADVVVANADATRVLGGLVQGVRPPKAPPSLSGFVLCLGVRGRTPGLAHHNVLFPQDYDAEFDDLFGPVPGAVADPAILCSVPHDPAVAPPRHESWFVLVNAPRHDPSARTGVDWDAPGFASQYATRVLDLMARRGLDIRSRVLFQEIRTPADLERLTGAPGGAIYGSSSNGPRAAFLRPPNRTEVPGLYLVGGSSHPGGGLPLVALSAKIVADLIGPA